MLSLLIIILVLLWAAVVSSIYWNISVFYSNFSESENYHKAYYASISALERWELVIKQRQPWYVWSGGFKMWTWQWSINNTTWWSDGSLSWFSYLWNNSNVSSVFRSINSRTTRIPAEWEWNIEWSLSTGDSKNYNMMDYENTEIFLLYYDNSNNNPYKSGGIIQSKPNSISWVIRLPKLLQDKWFWELDTSKSLVNWGTLPTDDSIVDRQIRWTYIYYPFTYPFTIYSTPDTNENKVWYENDTVFRESDINSGLNFNFTSSRDPIISNNSFSSQRGDSATPTIISQIADNMSSYSFQNVFKSNDSSWVQLRFSLWNLLEWSWHHYYPFLEYYVIFWTGVADKYFTINAEWNYKDYQVNTIIQRPTAKESILSNFTSIF